MWDLRQAAKPVKVSTSTFPARERGKKSLGGLDKDEQKEDVKMAQSKYAITERRQNLSRSARDEENERKEGKQEDEQEEGDEEEDKEEDMQTG